MDPEIKRKLDEQLGAGQGTQEEYESYHRKLEALQEADAILAQADEERVRAQNLRMSVDHEQAESPRGLALYWSRAISTFWISIQLASLLLVAFLLSKLGPFVPMQMLLGYIVGMVVGLPTYLIGCYRKSTLTYTSWWAASLGGAVSMGMLSFPIAIYLGYRIIRQPKGEPEPSMQTA